MSPARVRPDRTDHPLARADAGGEISVMARDELDMEILRSMTPEQKLAVMRSLIRQAYALKEAGVRAVHPDLAEEEIQARTRAAVAGDRP